MKLFFHVPIMISMQYFTDLNSERVLYANRV